jgi:hypothetical protein
VGISPNRLPANLTISSLAYPLARTERSLNALGCCPMPVAVSIASAHQPKKVIDAGLKLINFYEIAPY